VSSSSEFRATHRHKKTGGEYQTVAGVFVESAYKAYDFYRIDGIETTIMVTDDIAIDEEAVIYRNARLEYYIRPAKMFNDGRFEKL
jgi:uncharacterized UPF0146 family protein